ncbi:MAG: hypothetical protein AB3N64_00010 [Puniceicoccaceae bacterium]
MNRLSRLRYFFLCSATILILLSGPLSARILNEWEYRHPAPHNQDFWKVEYAEGIYVMTGLGGVLTTSTNLTDWNSVFYPDLVSLDGLLYANGGFMVTGGSGKILVSDDGLSWTERDTGATDGLLAAAYGNGRYVLTGEWGTTATSTDGISWTVSSTGDFNWYFGVTYAEIGGSDRFVAVSDEGAISTSSDGVSWSAATLPNNLPTLPEFYDVSYGGGLFVACGGYIDDNNSWGILIVTSTDGINWTRRTQGVPSTDSADPGTPTVLNMCRYDASASLWRGAGGSGVYMTSSDGISWTTTYPFNGSFTTFNAIDLNSQGQVVVGNRGDVYFSASGSGTWSRKTTGDYTPFFDIEFNGSIYVAAGTSTIKTSSDGLIWTEQTIESPGGTHGDVVYGNSIWVTGIDGNATDPIRTSTDGTNWVRPTTIASDFSTCVDLAFGNGKFLALPTTGTASLHTSTDGVTWTGSNPSWFNANRSESQIVFGNGGFLAFNNLFPPVETAWSTDGVSWTVQSTSLDLGYKDAAYGDGRWVLVGNNGRVATSTDLVTWSQQTLLDADGFPAENLKGVAFGKGHWVICGDDRSIWSSENGTTWTLAFRSGYSSATPENFIYNGAMFDGQEFWVVGNGGDILETEDNDPPVITCPSDAQVDFGDSTEPAATGTATAVDVWDPAPIISHSDSVAFDPCGLEIITRTWTATDYSGNSSSCTQTITVEDNTAPVIDPAPDDITVECLGDVPSASNLPALDNVDGAIDATPADSAPSGDPCGTQTITRTWTATDCSGNSSSVSQTITIVDTIGPVIDPAPTDITVECLSDVPSASTLPASDNCDASVTLATASDSAPSGDPCGTQTITRTWTATDCSGNSSSVSQTITIVDTIGPVIDPAPADITVECIGDVPSASTLPASDNCDASVTVATASDSAPSGDPCGTQTITRTWTATDCSGNSSSVSQTITIVDTIGPVIDPAPADITVECIGDVPPANILIASDNCDSSVVLATASDSPPTGDPCGTQTITRTWTATDCSGNSSSVSQTITIVDTIGPVIDPAPADITVECIGDVPPANILIASDNCDSSVVLATASDSAPSGDPCGTQTITRTWSATDCSGNSSSVSQTITIVDTIGPVIDPAPADITVECIGDVPPANILIASDNCDSSVVLATASDSPPTGDPCGTQTITRTWTATDCSGNSSSVSQTITIVDTIGPVIDPAPDDITVECIGDVPPANILIASDNCDSSVVLATASDSAPSGDPCGTQTITRTWTATDCSGNSSSVSQTITIVDTIGPVIDPAPADITVECLSDVPSASSLPASDNCDVTVTVATASDSAPSGDSCGTRTITRTWSATDCSGNSSSVSQTITIVDTIGPVIDPAPADITVECLSDVPSASTLPASDNCDATVTEATPSTSAPFGSPCGTQTIIRTWSASDCSGNSSSVSQTITIVDTTDPIISCPPDIQLLPGESTDPANTGFATATDACDPDPVVTYTDIVRVNPCGLDTITRTWRATDCSGNTTACEQIITVWCFEDPAQLYIFRLAPSNTMRLTILGVQGYTWDILVSSELEGGIWTKLTTIHMNSEVGFYDDQSFPGIRFYRLSPAE